MREVHLDPTLAKQWLHYSSLVVTRLDLNCSIYVFFNTRPTGSTVA